MNRKQFITLLKVIIIIIVVIIIGVAGSYDMKEQQRDRVIQDSIKKEMQEIKWLNEVNSRGYEVD